MQIINQKESANIALDKIKKTFVIYITYFKDKMLIYTTCKAQINLMLV